MKITSYWLARLIIECLGCAVLLLITWQVIVIGLADGLRPLVAVAVAGTISLPIAMIAHEFGHALAGWAVGLVPYSFNLVLVRFDRRDGRVTLRPNTWSQPATAVQFLALGAEYWRIALCVAAGPVASFALAGFVLAAAALVNPGPPEGVPVAAQSAWRDVALVWPGTGLVSWLNITGLCSFFLGVYAPADISVLLALAQAPAAPGYEFSDGTGTDGTCVDRVVAPDEVPWVPFHLVLMNDDTHTFGYVIAMLRQEFGYPFWRALELAHTIDATGRAVVFTGTRSEVERKRDRVLAAGADPASQGSTGPLPVLIEDAKGAGSADTVLGKE